MKFQDLSGEMQERILEMLNRHLTVSMANLAKDKCVLPMLLMQGAEPDSNNLVSLVPRSGEIDVDAALQAAIRRLKANNFDSALFSYSTQIGLSDGVVDAVKTYIFDKSGLTIVFFTPYSLTGFIKKKVDYGKTMIGEIIDNIFD